MSPAKTDGKVKHRDMVTTPLSVSWQERTHGGRRGHTLLEVELDVRCESKRGLHINLGVAQTVFNSCSRSCSHTTNIFSAGMRNPSNGEQAKRTKYSWRPTAATTGLSGGVFSQSAHPNDLTPEREVFRVTERLFFFF